MERLHGQVHHDRRVLADGIEHHGVFKFRRHLAQNVNALGLQLLKVSEVKTSHVFRSDLTT